MKTLKESLLDNIDSTLELGDNFMHKEKELHTIYKFKLSRWKNIYNGPHPNPKYSHFIDSVHIYKYVWNCPFVLHMNNKIEDLIDGDGRKIVFILYIEQHINSEGDKYIRPYLDIAILDKDNRILNVYQELWITDGNYITFSKTEAIKRVSRNYMPYFNEDKLIKILTKKNPDMLYNYEYIKFISIANLIK